MTYYCLSKQQKVTEPWKGCCKLSALNLEFAAKICLVTSFRETRYIEILPKDQNPSRELWLNFGVKHTTTHCTKLERFLRERKRRSTMAFLEYVPPQFRDVFKVIFFVDIKINWINKFCTGLLFK